VVESGRGVTLTPHPLLVPRSKKQSTVIPLLSLRAFVASEKGETYLPKIQKINVALQINNKHIVKTFFSSEKKHWRSIKIL
jgi:hypothetical protein